MFDRLSIISSLSALSLVTLSALGCNQQSTTSTETPRPVQVHPIKMVHPPEARGLMRAAAELLNSKNIQLGNGSYVRLSTASHDDISTFDKIGSSDLPAQLWVAPLTSLAASGKRPAQSDTNITDCDSLMSSPLGVVYRDIDEFALPKQNNQLTLASLLLPPPQLASKAPALLIGSPRFTSSGVLAALAATSLAASLPLSNLTPDVVGRISAELRKTQSMTRNYFVSDLDALSWLNGRESGDPLAVVTTEQSFRAFASSTGRSALQFKSISAPSAALDYPLCAVVSKGDSAQDVEALKATRVFFASDEFKSLLLGAGFLPAAAASDTAKAQVGATALELISKWPSIRSASSTVFVIDASIKTNRPTIETIRREIKLFIESRPSPDDMVALISASSTPDILSEPSTNAESLQLALTRLNTTGGNAIRDGILTALSLFSNPSTSSYRRSIVVFTSARDTSSRTSLSQVTNRAMQLVGRKNVDLFVIAFGNNESDFGELPELTKQVGGTFILTDIAALPSQFFPVARRIQ